MESSCHILVVDDEAGVASDTAALLNRAASSGELSQPVSARAETSFDKALEILSRGGIDLLVLDVGDQVGAGIQLGTAWPEPRGRSVFEKIRLIRFMPIIFLTALPLKVEDLESPPFVQMVSKRESNPMEALIRCVETCITSQFPRLYRELQVHVDGISRDFMIAFVEKNWEELKDRNQDNSVSAHETARSLFRRR